MRKPAAIESTVEMNYGDRYRIRVWRAETALSMVYPNSDVILSIKQCIEESRTPRACVDLIASLPRVAAVQMITVVDGIQMGVVLYTEWP